MARSSALRDARRRSAAARLTESDAPRFFGLASAQWGLMPERAPDRFSWDVTATLEALGAADAVLWTWEPHRDRLRLMGSARALGLGPLAPECSAAALIALALPQDREIVEDMLQPQAPGAPIHGRL